MPMWVSGVGVATSRMRTICSSSRMLGGVCSQGGGILACSEADLPHVDRQTGVKT